jgi:uncharacterized repeat protein (TIGR03803 family)
VGYGTVFKVNTNGTSFGTLYTFTNGVDGATPWAGLLMVSNVLYGTTTAGGDGGSGTVFEIGTNGTGFAVLRSFTALDPTASTNTDGSVLDGGLVLAGTTLYGTAYFGGDADNGTVFSLSTIIPPQLAIAASGANVILTWPTNSTGFKLESTTNLAPAVTWTTNSTTPGIVNGQNALTNPISGTQKFYRLVQ